MERCRAVLLVVLVIFTKCRSDELCTKDCSHSEGWLSEVCREYGFSMSDNCCLNVTDEKSTVVGIDLRNCSISRITESFFKSDHNVTNSLSKIKWIDLSDNPVTENVTDLEGFRGMMGLEVLLIPYPSFPQCLGTNDAWNETERDNSRWNCTEMRNYCRVISEKMNFTCPSNSHCSDDGPGLVACECDEGYYGYKCLKSGKFPYALFYGILTACTVVLSAFFWFTQRRHVKKHN